MVAKMVAETKKGVRPNGPTPLLLLEAAIGFEPMNNGFADRRLTTWLCRLWSGKRDLNPRPQPWQGCTLPLSYSRTSPTIKITRFVTRCQ